MSAVPDDHHDVEYVLVDLGVDCGLRESLQGFQEALGTQRSGLEQVWKSPRVRSRMVIVPGMIRMSRSQAALLLDLLEMGSLVLLESGAGFLGQDQFAVHQEIVRAAFEIRVEQPLELWERDSSELARPFAPYIEYLWPRETMMRDFSRVIPVAAQHADVIGLAGRIPVAIKKQVGKGVLIFLGSPLGTALRAGDAEAREWMRLVTAIS